MNSLSTMPDSDDNQTMIFTVTKVQRCKNKKNDLSFLQHFYDFELPLKNSNKNEINVDALKSFFDRKEDKTSSMKIETCLY